jgi:pimeloyl-ACP methyl ester carboxylesterase
MQTLHRDGFLDIDDMKLAYRMIGPQPGEAPTLVMLHDDSGSAATWESFPDRLAAETGLGVFVYSRATRGRLETEASRTLPHVLTAIGFRRGLLLGHGEGASIVTLYAGSVQDHRVRGLALMSPRFVDEDRSVDLTEALAYIRVPILIVQGSKNGTARQIEIAREECYCPVEAEILDAGYAPHREAPDATLRAVTAFTNRIMRLHAEALAA